MVPGKYYYVLGVYCRNLLCAVDIDDALIMGILIEIIYGWFDVDES